MSDGTLQTPEHDRLIAAVERARAWAHESDATKQVHTDAPEGGLHLLGFASLSRFMDDVQEALGQLFIAGVSFPDPDLGQELENLVRRAERYGLPNAVEQLGLLRIEMGQLSESADLFVRADRSEALWRRIQRVTAWLRLFRKELEVSRVEGRLMSQQQGLDAFDRSPDLGPTISVRCVPVGLLRKGRHLVYVSVEEHSGGVIHLTDPLAESGAKSPFEGLIISRLFREQIALRQQLAAAFELTEHPFALADFDDTIKVIGPAFSATAEIGAAPSVMPSLAPFDGRHGHPGRATISIAHDPRRGLMLRTSSRAATDMLWSRVFRLNALKLMIRDSSKEARLEATLLRSGAHCHLISARTDLDGRVYPSDDPACFRLTRVELRQLITSRAFTGLAARCLQTGGALFGAVSGRELDLLREEVDAGMGTLPDSPIARCLMYYLHPDRQPTDGELAASADRLRARVSEDSREWSIDARLAELITLAYGLAHGRSVTLDPVVVEALLAWMMDSERTVDAGWTEVCLRALAGLVAGAEEVDGEPSPAQFLDAHLELLRRGTRGSTAMLYPDVMELLTLAWVFRCLDRVAADCPALTRAELPWLDVATIATEALVHWRCHGDSAAHALEASAALMVLREADLGHLVVALDR